MEYKYCKRWSWYFRDAAPDLTPAKAAKLDAKGEEFCAVVGPMEQPECLIVVCGKTGFVAIWWPNELGQNTLEYHFVLKHLEVPEGENIYNTDRSQPLFLEYIYEREFNDDTNMPCFMTTYKFDRQGSVFVTRENIAEGIVEKGSRDLDVSGLYSPFPLFGDYEEIRRKERNAGF